MIKLTLHAVALIAVTIGATYSYEEVRFGERTASFFRVAFAEEGSARMGRGPRGHGGGERSDFERRRGTRTADSPEASARIEIRRRGGRGRRGATISLEDVAYYTIIFAFATLVTYTIDQVTKTVLRRRRSLA